jgi:hypothetical protein
VRLHAGHERHVVTEIRPITVDSSHVGGSTLLAQTLVLFKWPFTKQSSAVLVRLIAKTLHST